MTTDVAAAAGAALPLQPRAHRLWTPKRVLVTRAAAEQPHGAEIVRRCEAHGVDDITFLPGNRLTGLTGEVNGRPMPGPSRPLPWWSPRRAR